MDYTQDPLWWARSDSRLVMILDRAGCAVLRKLPRGLRRDPLMRRWRALVYRGDQVECPICGARFRHFAHRWNTQNAICWKCGSEERHRALWLFLTRKQPDLLEATDSLLHFAPEACLESNFRIRPGLRYVTCDLELGAAELTIDITRIDLPDRSFDAVICSHVLEHVPDDAGAMRELHRVLTHGGWCVVMVPIDPHLEETDEDATVTDPVERRQRFWQEDHVRLYGRDVVHRLAAAGFQVQRLEPREVMTPQEVGRFRTLSLGSAILLCRKRAAAA